MAKEKGRQWDGKSRVSNEEGFEKEQEEYLKELEDKL